MADLGRPAIHVMVHPGERGRGSSPVILPCACCSCCCCCLHSVGSFAGGVFGSIKKVHAPPRPVDPNFPFPYRRDELEEEGPLIPVTVLYWLLVTFLLGVGALWTFVAQGMTDPQSLLWGLVIGLMVLPLPQLVASLLCLFAILLLYRDRSASLTRLGHITTWTVVGTMVGGGVMMLICLPLMRY